MKFATVSAVAVVAAASSVTASPSPTFGTWGWSWNWGWGNGNSQPKFDLWGGVDSHVTKAIPCWIKNSKPAFCGVNKSWSPKLPCLNKGDRDVCDYWWFKNTKFCQQGPPQVPTPKPEAPCESNGWQVTQSNFTITPTAGVYAGIPGTGAAASDPSYLTYGLVKTLDECKAACDKVSGCVYFNIYQDSYPPEELAHLDLPPEVQLKYQPGTLTCSMFSKCLPDSAYVNTAGQGDPSYILASSGYCRGDSCKK